MGRFINFFVNGAKRRCSRKRNRTKIGLSRCWGKIFFEKCSGTEIRVAMPFGITPGKSNSGRPTALEARGQETLELTQQIEACRN